MNRLTYDSCAYVQSLNQSVSPLSYVLDPIRYEHCNKCRPELGIVGGTAVSHVKGNLVDLENDLRGQNRPSTHCPEYKHLPRGDGFVQGKEYIKPVCHPKVDVSLQHLKPCQIINYGEVPHAPPMNLFTCPAPAPTQQR
jgi:hypothetical protein